MVNEEIPPFDPSRPWFGQFERLAKEISIAFPKITYEEAMDKIRTIPVTSGIIDSFGRLMMWACGLQLQRSLSK
jgi:hypothetical protein